MPIIKSFSGLNNVDNPVLAEDGDLQICTNMFVNDGGTLVVRPGYIVTEGHAAAHSIWAYEDGNSVLYVSGNSLCRAYVDPGNPQAILYEAIYENLMAGDNTMSYCQINNKAYCVNGSDQIVVDGNSARNLGTGRPSTPSIGALAQGQTGTMPAGKYAVSIAYLRGDGSESGACYPAEATLSSPGGFSVGPLELSDDPFVVGINVYMTPCNGRTLQNGSGMYLLAALPHTSDQTVQVTAEVDRRGRKCRTLEWYRMRSGQASCFYRGRYFVASGDELFASVPWAYEFCELGMPVYRVMNDVTNLLPVENGIWVVGRKGYMFLSGKSVTEDGGFQVRTRGSSPGARGGVIVDGSLFGMRNISSGKVAMWVTSDGVMVGDSSGEATNVTRKKWLPPVFAFDGAGAVISVGNSYQYAFRIGDATYWMNIANRAVSLQDMSASGFTGLSGFLFSAGSNGLSILTGMEDNGVPITWTIEKKGITHGTKLLKRWNDLHLRGRCDGELLVNVIANNVTSDDITVTGGGALNDSMKVDLPRGMAGESLGIRVRAEDGLHAEIMNMETLADLSFTRRGRLARK